MKRLGTGLQARFVLAMGGAMLVVVAILLVLLGRQAAMQREVVQLSGGVIHELFDRSMHNRGEAMARELSDALANPLYYNDMEQIGALVRNAARQRVVSYVLVFDARGHLIHDGSVSVADYGRPMSDPLAAAAVAATGLKVQRSPRVLENSMPVMVGDQRLGGVRVGMALDEVQALEADASRTLAQRLDQVATRHLGWLLLMLGLLVAIGAMVIIYVQRTLVAPIRGLALAARQIEAGDYHVPVRENLRHDEVGELVREFARMRDAIARHDREVRRMAYTDALTGLTNRLAFREALDHRLASARVSGRQLGLLFADMDDFKRVNDSLGHEAGDEALLQFAQRISAAVQQAGGEEALLARFGGDEFVILVGAGDVPAQARTLAERLVHDLGKPLNVQGKELFLGSSIGVTLFPDDAADASTLLKNGDIAMYQAKMAGKNCYRYYSRAMDHAVERRVHMEQELRGAWERGELRLAYQPIFRTRDRRMVGVETLLRWQHPTLGTIPPSVFIEVAEKSGLIEVIGPKVLRAACREAAQWPASREGEHLFVSVNVSPRQLRGGELPELVAQCLQDTGLPASRLHIELTETAVIGDEMVAAQLLDKLHRTGVKVWLDDFGTGFSGLSHLRQVPVDGVKIDKSFVADMQRDPDDLALTTAIIAMAHALGITVVAEGIEQEVQFDLLAQRGCDLGQGYWLSRPVTATAIVQMLQ
ncbi:GGDEF domain-containing phosphodiesterase [Xanthomonas sp. 60]